MKDKELRNMSKALYRYDYLDAEEMDFVIKGGDIDKKKSAEKVREWD